MSAKAVTRSQCLRSHPTGSESVRTPECMHAPDPMDLLGYVSWHAAMEKKKPEQIECEHCHRWIRKSLFRKHRKPEWMAS